MEQKSILIILKMHYQHYNNFIKNLQYFLPKKKKIL